VADAIRQLSEHGIVSTRPDPRNSDRTLVRLLADRPEKAVPAASAPVDAALRAALGPGTDPRTAAEVLAALTTLAERLRPAGRTPDAKPAPAGPRRDAKPKPAPAEQGQKPRVRRPAVPEKPSVPERPSRPRPSAAPSPARSDATRVDSAATRADVTRADRTRADVTRADRTRADLTRADRLRSASPGPERIRTDSLRVARLARRRKGWRGLLG
jgi:general secretion pathway protein D